MTTVALMRENEIDIVANFIAELNKREEFHIGYCGKDKLEIAQYMKEETLYKNCFVTAYENGQLVGVLGFEPDDGVAEIWGPFALKEHVGIVQDMWKKILEILPEEINLLYLFPNKKNDQVLEFAANNAFTKQSEETILVFNRTESDLLKDLNLEELTPNNYVAMKHLHDKEFPGTYYSGQQIIDRLNDENKVFVMKENDELSGYIYVEAEPEFGDASIEFFAVSESKRGKGIGGKLLKGALKWLFTFDTIDSITLCVNSEDKIAIKLYKKVGFELEHELYSFKKIV